MKSFKKILFLLLFSIILFLKLPSITSAQTSTQNCGLLPSSISSQITANEPWYCPINQQIYSQWSGQLPALSIVVLLSFMISGAIFLVGVAFYSNRIRAFAIGEFYEAIATTIIVVGFLYVCAIMFGIIPSIFVGNINPYATSLNLISTTITTAQGLYTNIFNAYLSLSFVTSPTIQLEVGGMFGGASRWLLNLVGFAPQLFINTLTVPITIYFLDPALALARLLADGLAVLYAEYYLIIFFSVASIPAFLVPGIFFRSIFPTRALGGILIALAIGFYLVMPTLFAVAYYFTAPTVQTDMALASLQLSRFSAQGQSGASSPQAPLVMELSNAQSSLNGFWLLIFFYPGLIVAITYSAIQEIANFIGRAAAISSSIRKFI